MPTALANVQKFFPKVTSVVDASRNASIEVLQKDVTIKGKKNHRECAMALACKRKFNLDGVIIAKSTAYLVKGTKARRFILPASVQKEIISFDRGANFEPGKYQLNRVSESVKLGPRGRPQNTKNREGLVKRAHHVTENVREALNTVK